LALPTCTLLDLAHVGATGLSYTCALLPLSHARSAEQCRCTQLNALSEELTPLQITKPPNLSLEHTNRLASNANYSVKKAVFILFINHRQVTPSASIVPPTFPLFDSVVCASASHPTVAPYQQLCRSTVDLHTNSCAAALLTPIPEVAKGWHCTFVLAATREVVSRASRRNNTRCDP
jgi:hypothetical protein